MRKIISWLIIQFLFLVSIFSCETGLAPSGVINHEERVLIWSTGNSYDRIVQFKFQNTLEDTLLYLGYSKGSPLYAIQISSDTGWVNVGRWCGTGTKELEFAPKESFLVDVHEPCYDRPWRVGLYTYLINEQAGKYSWSKAHMPAVRYL